MFLGFSDPFIKFNFKYIKDYNVIPETWRLLEETIDNALHFISVEKDLVNRIPFAQELRATNEKWDLEKLKSFYREKERIILIKLSKAKPKEI